MRRKGGDSFYVLFDDKLLLRDAIHCSQRNTFLNLEACILMYQVFGPDFVYAPENLSKGKYILV